jgi:hypothetical protein
MKTLNLKTASDAEINACFAEVVAGWKPLWLLTKDGYYYRPKAAGYTSNRAEAGRFDKAYAERDVSATRGEVQMEQDAPPDYLNSADAVLPWLEKCRRWKAERCAPDGVWLEVDAPRFGDAYAPTFARAACIALLKAHGVSIEE